MIENVPVPTELNNAAVIVRSVSHRHSRRLVAVYVEICVAYQYSTIGKAAQRTVAYRIAKLVHYLRGIDQEVLPAYLADRRSLKESVSLKACAGAVFTPGNDRDRFARYRKHIPAENDRP